MNISNGEVEDSCVTESESENLSLGPKNVKSDDVGQSNSTDNSDLEDFCEDSAVPKPSVDINQFLENSTVLVNSLNPIKQEKKLKIPHIVKNLIDPSKIEPSDSDGESESEQTIDDVVEVNQEDFKSICKEFYADKPKELELKSYQSSISTHSGMNQGMPTEQNDTNSETSEEDMSGLVKNKVDYDSGDETDVSDLEVTMKEYYAIRHETNEFQERRFSLQEALDNIPDYADEFPAEELKRKYSHYSTDEDSIKSDDQQVGDEDDTCISELQVTMKEYYQIRHQTTPKSDGMNEYILEMNAVESRIKQNTAAEDDDTEGEEIWLDEPPKESKNKQVHSEQISSEDNSCATDTDEVHGQDSDVMTPKDYLHAHRTDYQECEAEPAVIKLPSSKFISKDEAETHSVSEVNSESSHLEANSGCSAGTEMDNVQDSLSLDDFYGELQYGGELHAPTISLREIDGMQGAIGIISAPRSVANDSVFGIKFINKDESRDLTEEYSNLSDMDDQVAIESGHQSPATEDEVVSDFEAEACNPHPHYRPSQYFLPSPRKNTVLTKEEATGSSKTVQELLNPCEVLSLGDFVKETEGKSEVSILHLTEDELEDLPTDAQNQTEDQTSESKESAKKPATKKTENQLKPPKRKHRRRNGKHKEQSHHLSSSDTSK